MTTVKRMMLASIFIVVSISSNQAQKLQKKVGTNPTITNPSAALEVESTTKGFLPPRMTIEQMTAIVTPPTGLMVYCTNCIPVGLCVFDGTIWTQLASATNTWIDANCSSNGFSGTFASGIPLSGATFTTTITNDSFNTAGPFSFSADDLVLSGVSGLVVGTPSPASVNINPRSSQLITYPITGTPASTGTLTGTWTNGTLTCSNIKEVETPIPAAITLTSAAETTNQITMSSATITPITYTVTGTGVSNVTVTGLPTGVTYSYNSGTLTISGTPTVNGDYSYTITTIDGIPNATVTGRIAVVIIDCLSNGFSGTFASGISLSGATFSMTITNNSSNAVGPISFSASNLVLSGVSGLVVGTPSPVSASINPGDSQLITYPITGTPASAGTLTGTWTNGLLSCSNTKEIGTPAVITLTSATDTNNQIAMSSATITPITYTVTGTGVSNVTVTGLPTGVTYSYNSGTLTISGTPTVNGDYSYTITTIDGIPNATATGRISVVIVNCSSNGFSGTFASGIPLSGATFSMTITNNSSNVVGPISFSASDLVLSGVSGLVVGTPTPASASISPGDSQLITYSITGTPASAGTLTGTWTNGLLSCSNTKEVETPIPATISLTSAAGTTNQIAMSSATITPITYTVTGTGVSNVTVTGLPAGVTYSYNSGTLTISGAPTVNGDFTYTITTVDGIPNATATGRISVVIVNCSSNGFSGTFASGIPLSGATFSMTITNNSSNAVGPISFSTSNLVLSGVSGLVVGTPSPASASINPGASQLITYPITGTPASTGTLTGTWTNGLLSCSNTKAVITPIPAAITLTSATGTNNQLAIPNDTAITPITYSVTGTGVTNATVTGMPPGVSHSYNIGTGTLTISGAATVSGNYTYTITTAGGAPNTTATGLIRVMIKDKMYGVADNSTSTVTHKFLYLPVTGPDGKTWLNNNLGAKYSDTNHASYSPAQQATSQTDLLAYGNLFQWGRKPDGHERMNYSNSTTGVPVNGTTSANTNSPTSTLFITETVSPFDWRTSIADTLWSTEASANNPCPVGYRVPTTIELGNFFTAGAGITNGTQALNSSLKLTRGGGFREGNTGLIGNAGTSGYYWSSSPSGTGAFYFRINSSSMNYDQTGTRTMGAHVRCIKN